MKKGSSALGLRMEELISDMGEVIEVFLGNLVDPFDHWYPVGGDGEVDREEAKRLYLGHAKELGDDDLRGRMPPMRYQPKKGSSASICLREYKPSEHGLYAIRNEAEFREKRASFAAVHPTIHTIGSRNFFGGYLVNLDSHSVLRSPLWFGERVTIRFGAKIVGPALIGDKTFVNTNSVVKRAVICAGTQIEENVVLSDSIVGHNVFIEPGVHVLHRTGFNGDGVVIRDYRDAKLAEIKLPRRKIVAIIGDRCRIGAGSVIEPGTVLLPGCNVPRGVTVSSGIYTPNHFKGSVAGLQYPTTLPNCS